MNKVKLLLVLMLTLNGGKNIDDEINISNENYIIPQTTTTVVQSEDNSEIEREFSKEQVLDLMPAFKEISEEKEEQKELPKETVMPKVTEPTKPVEVSTQTVTPKMKKIELSNNRNIDATKPMCALTFDDGPNYKNTNKILDTLEKYGVVATFFDLGSLVEKNPEVVKRGENLGCEIGNHSYGHKDYNKLSNAQINEDIRKSEQAFIKAIGHKTSLFRVPYGNANQRVRGAIDYPLINWNVDTLDWKTRNSYSIISEVRKIKNYDGKIILMHSIYESTAKALETIVPELMEKGYQLVTVSELAYYKGYTSLQCGKIYYNFTN